MKKVISLALALFLLCGLSACGDENGNTASDQTPTTSAQSQTPEETTAVPDDNAEDAGEILVAYFSATGNTKGIAETISEHLGADLYEIIPEEPYSSDDLDYNTDCRANREQNDDSARPAISGGVEDMEQYNVVFLGYPIWWGRSPKIIYTFLESYDFSGKTVIPFCTSGSSPYNDSGIKDTVAGDTTWIAGNRFSGGAEASAVTEWVDSLALGKNS